MSPHTAQPWTRTLSAWAAGLRYEHLPSGVVHHARRVLLDYLAAAVAGSTAAPARVVQDYLRENEGSGPATVIGTTLRCSPANAALANGTAAHALEVDDGYTPGAFHPGSPVLSAVLAVAEARGASREDVVLATAVGYEVSCRLAGAGHPATWKRGFHNTPIAGVFGAAAAVSSLRGADEDTHASAMGLAGSHAGGLFEFLGQGAEVKRLHAGKAARDGVLSADLAARGLTGARTILEGVNGYGHAFAGDELDAEHLLGALGERWRMLDTYVKPYPCCRHLHGPIDAVLQLRDAEPVQVASLRSIRVETYTAAAKHRGTDVADLLDAQMSIPYAVAVTLVHGVPALRHFEHDVRADGQVRRIIDMVQVLESDDCVRDYPSMRPARVVLETAGGRRELRIDQPYGEPSNPVSDADLEAKFIRLAAPVLGEDRCRRVLASTWGTADPRSILEELRLTPGTESRGGTRG